MCDYLDKEIYLQIDNIVPYNNYSFFFLYNYSKGSESDKTFPNIVKSQMTILTPYLLVRTQSSLDGNRNFVVLNRLWVKQLFQKLALTSLLLRQLWGEVRWVWDTAV